MKRRNQLLALFCLIAFGGLGILYFQHWVVQTPFAVILFVGEGLAPHELAATRLYVGGADAHLSLDAMPHVALLMNASKDFSVPDQAAAATAIATGVKVNNGAISVGPDGRALSTLLEAARQRGRATGLITDCNLTNTAAAAFYAHSADANDRTTIAQQLAEGQKIDVIMGGGALDFSPENKGGRRADNRDLLLQMRSNGFDVARTRADLEAIPAWRRSRLIGLFANDDLGFEDELEQRKEQPELTDMVRRAIELLQYNGRGYLLVVDAGLMRKAAVQNKGERTLRAMAELDRAVAMARRYAGPKSTIIVCGDVAVGGMALNGFPFHRDSGIALLGLNASGEPWITWATGPNGTRSYGAAKLEDGKAADSQDQSKARDETEPGAFYRKGAANTAEDTLALGIGPGTDGLAGISDNTIVFKLIRDQL